MSATNKAMFIGRVAADPERKTFTRKSDGSEFSKVTFRAYVTNRRAKRTDIVSFEAYHGTADMILEYVKKGTLIGLESEFKRDTWKDDDGHHERIVFEVSSFELLTPKDSAEEPEDPAPEYSDAYEDSEEIPEDIY